MALLPVVKIDQEPSITDSNQDHIADSCYSMIYPQDIQNGIRSLGLSQRTLIDFSLGCYT